MTNINRGIINTGSIGGYGSGNVIAPGSVVDIQQRAQKVERERRHTLRRCAPLLSDRVPPC